MTFHPLSEDPAHHTMEPAAQAAGNQKRASALFRSEKMAYLNIYVDVDAAKDAIYLLGREGTLQFEDMRPGTTPFQRTFANQIKQCEEVQRKLRFLREHIEHEPTITHRLPETTAPVSLADLDVQLNEWETDLQATLKHIDSLTRNLGDRQQQHAVFNTCAKMLALSPFRGRSASHTSRVHPSPSAPRHEEIGTVNHVTGVILRDRIQAFEMVLFRVSRGNCFVNIEELPEDSAADRDKVAFLAFFAGTVLGRKISRVAESFGASIYILPHTPDERSSRLLTLEGEIQELQMVLTRTTAHRTQLLRVVSQHIRSYETLASEEKSVYHVLNLFDSAVGRRGMHVSAWCPSDDLPRLQASVDRMSLLKRVPRPLIEGREVSVGEHGEAPPTHFPTNRLTSGFQAIVEAYGVADYREFNPTPFTVITFPFLFAVMFGDVGHGLLMLLFALYMLINERRFLREPPGEIFMMCFAGRYVVLLMSLFSIYTGLLYNDTFALAFDWWGAGRYQDMECIRRVNGTCVEVLFPHYRLVNNDTGMVLLQGFQPFPFGLDPVWKMSLNELSFTNSLKMKLSIVLGVTQMSFGVILSGLNHRYFKNHISLIHEFIPQLIFLWSVFGYMVLTIFVKWGTYYENTHCAPSILTTFIDMFLSFGAVNKVDVSCPNDGSLFPGQGGFELFLLLIAFGSVPWMLLAKPLLLRRQYNQRIGRNKHRRLVEPESSQDGSEGAVRAVLATGEPSDALTHQIPHFDFPEEMVHQIIHTIEFVLGAVSNTASYLRLWALSLAHAQLSTVFWEKIMIAALETGPIAVLIGFVVWCVCTLGVLMVMESLSAFLHALRLHWVEFQNKFYKGTGKSFSPFIVGETHSHFVR